MVVKSELLRKLNEKIPDLLESDVTLALDCILGQMVDALVNGDRIEIRGFGSFEVRRRPPRLACNPKTGEKVKVSAKVRSHFKPGKELRNRVKASRDPFVPITG